MRYIVSRRRDLALTEYLMINTEEKSMLVSGCYLLYKTGIGKVKTRSVYDYVMQVS